MSTFNKKLRSILLKDGRIPATEIEKALHASAEDKTPLSRFLVSTGKIGEKELVGLLSREIGFAPIDLDRFQPDPEVMTIVTEEMALEHGIFPVSKIGNFLTVAVADPFDVLKLDHVRIVTRCDIRPVVTSEAQLKAAIKKAYAGGDKEVADLIEGFTENEVELEEEKKVEAIDLNDLQTAGNASPVVKLVNLIIFQAVRERVSDIHIEPYEQKVRVRYRRDGILADTVSPPKNLQNALVSRIKIMAGLDIAERRKPQDGKFQVKAEGRHIDFRISVLPVVHGEKVVMRVLDGANLSLRLDALGFEEKALQDYRKAISQPYGMILVTGPTGSGKSTTLYSAVREIATPENNLVTVEDPVEYQLDGISQVPVNPKRGVTFATALRSILRQDPDIILIGEIRDGETLEIAVKAALTGHLVMSTLHTNDAASAITRMTDMGLDPFLVSCSCLLVCAQRLCRTLCQNCRKQVDVPKDRLLSLGFLEQDFQQPFTLYQAVGCAHCSSGYRGRFAILETLAITDAIKRMIVELKPVLDIKARAVTEGMLTLRRTAILNAMRGKTSLEEVLRVTLAD